MDLPNLFLACLAAILTALALAGVAAARGNASAFALLQRAVHVERNEVSAMLIAAVYFFCTFTSYSLLRPIRDEMAVASGVRDLPMLFLATLVTMAAVTPIYGALVSRFPVRRFVRAVYRFIALNLVLFYFAWKADVSPITLQWAFFAWLTVYAVFGPSMFWSVMADTFSSAQGKRLFGFIGVGGTIGSVTGLSITSFLTREIGRPNLMLVSAALVLIASMLARLVPKAASETDTIAFEKGQAEVIGGGALAGAAHVLSTPYLAGIAGFLFLFVFGSTVLYSAQTEIIGRVFADRVARTEVLAQIELAAQLVSAFGQVFLTGRVMRRGGVAVAIAAVPVVSIVGFAALGATAWGVLPLLATFIVFNVARRSSEFMLTQPARKVLFTVLSREDKYKTANFLETFVYRAGDQVSIWGYAALAGLGFALTDIAWMTIPVSVAYLLLALWLARRQKVMAAAQTAVWQFSQGG